jgi:hypothetical protein
MAKPSSYPINREVSRHWIIFGGIEERFLGSGDIKKNFNNWWHSKRFIDQKLHHAAHAAHAGICNLRLVSRSISK